MVTMQPLLDENRQLTGRVEPVATGYVVVRTFKSRRGLMTYHVAVGPFPTKWKALTYRQQAIREYGYPPKELVVAIFRPPQSQSSRWWPPCGGEELQV